MTQLREKAVKGVAWTAIGNWGNYVTSFVVLVLLTRLLRPEDFGLVAMASVFVAFVSIFSEQGLSQALVQRQQIDREHLDTAFWTNIIIGSGLTLLGVLLSGAVAALYREPRLQPIVALLSVSFLLTALNSTQQAQLQRALQFRALATRNLIAGIIGGVVGVVMALMGAGVYALVGKTLATALTAVVVLWQVSGWRPRFSYSRRHFRDLFTFGMSMTGVKLTNFLCTRLDDLLIGYFLGAQALGFYTVAYRLGRLMLDMFTAVMGSVAIPTFARLQNDADRLRSVFYRFSSMTGMVTFPAFMGLILLAPDLIAALSGDRWSPSAPIMRVLSIAGFSLSLQFFVSYLLIALGKPDRLFILNVFVTVVTATAFVLSVRYGILRVALAYAVVNISFYGIYLAVAHQVLPLDFRRYFGMSWRFFIPSAFMGILLFFLNNYLFSLQVQLYIRLLLKIILGASLYVGMVFLLYRSAFQETRKLVLSIIPGRRWTVPQHNSVQSDDIET